MSRFHAPPNLIENRIELFLDNFKYVTSVLDSEFGMLDCKLENHLGLEFSGKSRSSESLVSTSVSGPKQSVTSPSENCFSSLTSSVISNDLATFELEPDPSMIASARETGIYFAFKLLDMNFTKAEL